MLTTAAVAQSERGFDRLDRFGVFGVGKKLFVGRHHLERGAEARAVFVFWDQVKMQMRQFIGVCTVVDLGRAEGGLDGFGGASDVFGEESQFCVRQFKEFVDVPAVGYDAAAWVSLFPEQIER